MNKRIASALRNTFLLLASTFVALLIVELGLLFFLSDFISQTPITKLTDVWETHPTRGWQLKPNIRTRVESPGYSVPYSTNSRRLRDSEHEPGDSENFRIVLLGDSFMEGQQVGNGATLPDLLENALDERHIEVINLSVSGYGTLQQLQFLLEEGLKYTPDLVLLAFYAMNDVHNNSYDLSYALWKKDGVQAFGRPYPSPEGSIAFSELRLPDQKVMENHLKVLNADHKKTQPAHPLKDRALYKLFLAVRENPNFSHWISKHEANISLGVAATEFAPRRNRSQQYYERLWEDAWSVTSLCIQEMKNVCQENEAEFLVFTVPSRLQTEPEFLQSIIKRRPNITLDTDMPHRRLKDICEANQVRFYDLAPAFKHAHAAAEGPLFLFDQHWNKAAHRIATENLLAYLDQNHLLPSAP